MEKDAFGRRNQFKRSLTVVALANEYTARRTDVRWARVIQSSAVRKHGNSRQRPR